MSSIETSIETPLASPSLSFFFTGISQDISNRLGGLKTQTTSVLPWFLMDEPGMDATVFRCRQRGRLADRKHVKRPPFSFCGEFHAQGNVYW